MALARVVTFDGVSKERMEGMDREMSEGAAEGLQLSELIVLHDPDAEQSLVVVIFETDDDYRKGDEILSAMPGHTPGQRTSVKKYNVATRMRS